MGCTNASTGTARMRHLEGSLDLRRRDHMDRASIKVRLCLERRRAMVGSLAHMVDRRRSWKDQHPLNTLGWVVLKSIWKRHTSSSVPSVATSSPYCQTTTIPSSTKTRAKVPEPSSRVTSSAPANKHRTWTSQIKANQAQDNIRHPISLRIPHLGSRHRLIRYRHLGN